MFSHDSVSFGGAYLAKSDETNYMISLVQETDVRHSDRLGIVEPLMHDAEFREGSGCNLSLLCLESRLLSKIA